jgi:hypothetical protein
MKKVRRDFERFFAIFDEGIFVNIFEEKSVKSAQKILRFFFMHCG